MRSFVFVLLVAALAIAAFVCSSVSPSAAPAPAPTKIAGNAPCPAGWRSAVSGMALTPLSDQVQVRFSWDRSQVYFDIESDGSNQDAEPIVVGMQEKIFLASDDHPVGPQPIRYLINTDYTACVEGSSP